MDFPTRLPKFIGRQSMRVPQDVKLNGEQIREFKFARMTPKYERLRDALALLGLQFDGMGWESARSGQGFVAWVGTVDDPLFIWNKMTGGVPGVAGNSCYSKYAAGAAIFKSEIEWNKNPQDLIEVIVPCDLKRAILEVNAFDSI